MQDGDVPNPSPTEHASLLRDLPSPAKTNASFSPFQTFRSLSIPSYRYLWFGSLLQMGAMQMQMMTRGYFVYELTRSASMLGYVMAGAAGPGLLFGLFGGVIADRLDKRRIIQAAQLVSGALALFIAVSITTGTVTWQHLLFASVIHGSVMPLMMPARQAIVPRLVGRDLLTNAIALNSMGMSVNSLVAPALAGLVISGVGIGGAYYLISGMNIAAIFLTALVPASGPVAGMQHKSVFRDLADGLAYVKHNRTILVLLLLSFSTMILAMPIRFILPIFAKDIFLVGPRGLGFMMSAMGIGSLVGALVIASAGKLASRGLVLSIGGVFSGAVLLAFAIVSQFAPVFWAGTAILTVVGFMQAGRTTLNNSLLIESSDEKFRGRVMGLFALNMALMPASVLPITIASEFIGAPTAVGIVGIALALISGIFVISSGRLRRLQ